MCWSSRRAGYVGGRCRSSLETHQGRPASGCRYGLGCESRDQGTSVQAGGGRSEPTPPSSAVVSGAHSAGRGRAKPEHADAGAQNTAQQFASAIGVATVGALFFTALHASHGAFGYPVAMTWAATADFALILLVAALIQLSIRAARTN